MRALCSFVITTIFTLFKQNKTVLRSLTISFGVITHLEINERNKNYLQCTMICGKCRLDDQKI